MGCVCTVRQLGLLYFFLCMKLFNQARQDVCDQLQFLLHSIRILIG
jgi:hypothetical protein